MPTKLTIDDELLQEAQKMGGHRTKKATITEALEEYIRHRKQLQILELFGKIEYDPAYDYRAWRKRRI